jgi:hypothetical protein
MWPAWRGWCTPARATALRGSFRHDAGTIALDDVPPQPWKNGGGTTRELLAWPRPPAGGCELSVAEVAADGPFSRFEGVQRWFAVLQGAGVVWWCDDQASMRSRPPAMPRWPLTAGPIRLHAAGRRHAGLQPDARVAPAGCSGYGCNRSNRIDATNLIAVYATSARAEVHFGLKPDAGARHPGWRRGRWPRPRAMQGDDLLWACGWR